MALLNQGTSGFLFITKRSYSGRPPLHAGLCCGCVTSYLFQILEVGHSLGIYADDSSCAASLLEVCGWFDGLRSLGLDYGYYPQPTKSVLVVTAENVAAAQERFGDLGIRVVTGLHFLGGFIGDKGNIVNYVQTKVEEWVKCVDCLVEAAVIQPQAAYAALSHSL